MMGSAYFTGETRSEMLFNSNNTQYEEKDEKVKLFQVPYKNIMIALLDHPASITLYHYVSVEVMSGSVSIYGYEIKKGNLPVKVFSSEKTGLIEVKTESFDRIWKKTEDALNLEDALVHITDDRNMAKKVLEKYGNSTVAIAVQWCILPPNLQYLELYYPHVVDFNLFKTNWLRKDYMYVPRHKNAPIEFDLDAEKIASEINIYVRGAKLTDAAAPRILVCGPRNTGKSSLLRFLINKILSIYVVAFYLDTDPGQTEFTPPGLVSLTKVTKPIVGPPFSHLKKPVSMIFTGGISADSSPDMYSKSVCKLMDLYNREFSEEPLFVNTMGWMEGLGLYCLQNVISAVKPTVLIELVNEDEVSMFDYRDYLPKESHYFQICRSFSSEAPSPNPQEMRNISLLSYFGKCQNPFEGPLYLNEIKPYCVSWDKIPVFIFGKKVPSYRMIEAINASIVALCKVPETIILESDFPQFPKTLEDEPDNECLGYGLVRAVNEKDHLLYIITPLSLSELQEVNAIIKGNILVPDAVFLKQPLYNTELPFTNERALQKMPSPTEDEDMADCSMLTLKSNSDCESPAVALTARGSVASYRRKISKRYRRLHK